MPTDADSICHSADWFLIACDGDLALRITRELRIGEHTSGDLILCADEAGALMSLRVESGKLILAAVALDWTFTDANGNGFQHLSFPPGVTVRLDFPHGQIDVRPQLTGDTDAHRQTFGLQPTSPPSVALRRVSNF